MKEVKPFSWIVRFDVAPTWVADGFVMNDASALEMLARELGWADVNTELAAAIISAPDAYSILSEQGYQKCNAEELGQIVDGAPLAYQKPEGISAIKLALLNAISLIDSVAFVRDENDNTAEVLDQLRIAMGLVEGSEPISDIEWQKAD